MSPQFEQSEPPGAYKPSEDQLVKRNHFYKKNEIRPHTKYFSI